MRLRRAARGTLLLAAFAAAAACRCGPPGRRVSAPSQSGGCEEATQEVRGGWSSVAAHGRERRFILDVPAAPPGERLPVVIAFHGIGGDPGSFRDFTGLGERAHERGFIAVHPEGETVRLGVRVGPGWSIASEDNRDVAFTRAVIDRLESTRCVDSSRVYAAGFSNGAHFTHVLGCRMPERVAGIAAVGGALENMAGGCGAGPALPVIVIHGGADPVVGVEQGRAAVDLWKEKNGCEGVTRKGPCDHHEECVAPVVYCELGDLAHVWPGAARGDALDATDAVLDFFLEGAEASVTARK